MSRVRITGGEWRSRLIQVVDAPGLRPTPDRVRETLFNWLGQSLDGLTCLDLFAGSGALGFEAASRGAARITLVEKSRRVFSALQNAARTFSSPRIDLVCADALEFAAKHCDSAGPPFDLVFLDPPYGQAWLPRLAPSIDALASAHGRMYVEAEIQLQPTLFHDWKIIRQGHAGQVFFHLLERT